MSSTAQVSRLLALVPWLQARKGATIEQAADWFEVTEAQIRQDLEHLDFCGLPGLHPGDLFEVHYEDDRVSLTMAEELRRPLRLTPAESLRLVLRLEAVAQALGDELPALRSALDKVRSRAQLPPVRVDLAADGGWHAILRQAIVNARRVAIEYQGRGDEVPRSRLVDPWALQISGGHWYLAAHDDQAAARRSFRLDRIVMVKVLDEAIAVPVPAGPLPAPAYEPGPEDVEVVLDVTARGRWLAEAVSPATVIDQPDGGARLTLRTDAPGWIAGLVLSAQGEARVAAPLTLRADVAAAATQALAEMARG